MNPDAHIVQVTDREPCGTTEKSALSIVADHPEICAFTVTAYTAPVPELDAVTGTDRHSVPLLLDAIEIWPMWKLGDATPLGAPAAVVCVTGFGALLGTLCAAAVDGVCRGGAEIAAIGLADTDGMRLGLTETDCAGLEFEAADALAPTPASIETADAECATAAVRAPPAHAATQEPRTTSPAHAPIAARSGDPLPIKNLSLNSWTTCAGARPAGSAPAPGRGRRRRRRASRPL